MNTNLALARRILALTALFISAAITHAQSFQPGQILVDDFTGSNVRLYSPTGSLLQTFSGSGRWEGAALTPDGNLVTHNINTGTVYIYTPGGTLLNSFFLAGGSFAFATDVSVFNDGTLAINFSLANQVGFYNQSGTLLQTVNLASGTTPSGSAVGSDGILYVAGHGSNNINRVSESGSVLGTISLSFTPGDLVMNPLDGTLWVSDETDDTVVHIRTDGTVLGSFATGLPGLFDGIGLAPDDNSLYVTSESSTSVDQFDLNGNLLGSFALTSPNEPLFMTVVPATPAPEPGSAALLGFGLPAMLGLIPLRRRTGK